MRATLRKQMRFQAISGIMSNPAAPAVAGRRHNRLQFTPATRQQPLAARQFSCDQLSAAPIRPLTAAEITLCQTFFACIVVTLVQVLRHGESEGTSAHVASAQARPAALRAGSRFAGLPHSTVHAMWQAGL